MPSVSKVVLSFLPALAMGCGSYETAAVAPAPPPAPAYDDVSSRAIVVTGAEDLSGRGAAGGVGPIDRQIVREAWAVLEVDDPHEEQARVVALVPPPGFVEGSHFMEEAVQLTLRVPASHLDGFLGSLEDVGDVEQLSMSGQDVTAQMVDWDARVRNLTELRNRLRQHLERATTVEELVLVERELSRVQTELDALTAQLETMRGNVALSRVTVVLNEGRQLGPLGYLFYGLGRVIGWLFVID